MHNTLFFSKVGDNAIDLPDAQVIIQISSHGKARRQEAQRLGRILRPKKGKFTKKGHFNAFFYTIISENTREADNAPARQSYLINQGYTYELLNFKDIEGVDKIRGDYLKTEPDFEETILELIMNKDYSKESGDEDQDNNKEVD
jgi:DNA excision repair protein ERCC-3